MTLKIDKKIKGFHVIKPEAGGPRVEPSGADAGGAEVIHMHESLQRPQTLLGATYKVKSPLFEHALYVTINDIVLNEGTQYEVRRPFEIFINSKNMDHFQWIVALTRIMSAVFRKGGDVTFLVEEMRAVFDPRGGYFKAGGVYMPSIVAEIGAVIEQHMKRIGLIKDPEMSASQRALVEEKRAAYAAAESKATTPAPAPAAAVSEPAAQAPAPVPATPSNGDFPASAKLCSKCNTKALVLMDNCQTCLNCGYSKCG